MKSLPKIDGGGEKFYIKESHGAYRFVMSDLHVDVQDFKNFVG